MKKNMKKIVALVLTTVAIGASSVMIFAQSSTPLTGGTERQPRTEMGMRGPEKELDTLVSKGVITQETADKITAFMQTKAQERKDQMDTMKSMTPEERKAYMEANKPKENPWDTMVSEGVITQADADAIKAAMPQRPEKDPAFEGKDDFKQSRGLNPDELVSQGMISQSTADKMTTFLEANQQERQAQMDAVKNMTPEERQVYFQANKDTRENIFDTMVANGVLTQSEADAIQAAKPQRPEDGDFQQDRKGGRMNLDSYVTQGIISQDTADKAKAFFESQKDQWQAEKDKLATMTQDERKAYLQEKKDNKTDWLDTLVSNGILTQDEANQIKTANEQ